MPMRNLVEKITALFEMKHDLTQQYGSQKIHAYNQNYASKQNMSNIPNNVNSFFAFRYNTSVNVKSFLKHPNTSMKNIELFRCILCDNDQNRMVYPEYSVKSHEHFYLTLAQDVFTRHSEQMLWVVNARLGRISMLLQHKHPNNNSKMGIFYEAAELMHMMSAKGKNCEGIPFFEKTTYWLSGDTRNALHQFKYNNDIPLSKGYALPKAQKQALPKIQTIAKSISNSPAIRLRAEEFNEAYNNLLLNVKRNNPIQDSQFEILTHKKERKKSPSSAFCLYQLFLR